MNGFLIILEKLVYGTFNQQQEMRKDFLKFQEYYNNNKNRIIELGPLHFMISELFGKFYGSHSENLNIRNEKYTFMQTILSNTFISNKLRKEFERIYISTQKTYFTLNKFAFLCKWKRSNLGCNSDMYLNPITEKDKNVLSIIHENTKYLFTLVDVKKIISQSLSTNDELYCDPQPIKNPYNNIPFSKSNLYEIYFFIKNSDYLVPPLFQYYFQCDFSLRKLLNQHEPSLRNRCIKKVSKNKEYNTSQLDYIYEMIENYNLTHFDNQINIDDGFPDSTLHKAFLPFVCYYLKSLYSLDISEKNENRLLINAMLYNFQEKNKLFGKNYFKSEYNFEKKQKIFKKSYHTSFSRFESPILYDKNYNDCHKTKKNQFATFVNSYLDQPNFKTGNTHIRWRVRSESESNSETDSDGESQETESVS